jgi:hypothetical protein
MRNNSNKKGLTLIVSLLISSLILLISISLSGLLIRHTEILNNFSNQTHAFFLAEGAREIGLSRQYESHAENILLENDQETSSYHIEKYTDIFPTLCKTDDVDTWISIDPYESIILPLDYENNTPRTKLFLHYFQENTNQSTCINWEIIGKNTTLDAQKNTTENISGTLACGSLQNSANIIDQTGVFKQNNAIAHQNYSAGMFLDPLIHTENYLIFRNISQRPLSLCVKSQDIPFQLPENRVYGYGHFNNSYQWTRNENNASQNNKLPFLDWNWFQTR